VAHTGPAEPFSANGDNNADAIEPCVTPALLQVANVWLDAVAAHVVASSV
jgi:hypothetical protein